MLSYPRPVVARCGTDTTLRCQIDGDPRPDVVWERKNVRLAPGERYTLSEEGKAYLLTITAVTVADGGQYVCKARNSVGETYAAASLKVEEGDKEEPVVGGGQMNGHCATNGGVEKDEKQDERPRFLIRPLSLRVDRGEDAAFAAKVSGSPSPRVTWEKDGKQLTDVFESSHFTVVSQDGGWFQLRIHGARIPDAGVYTCRAAGGRHGSDEALAAAVLLVEAVPERREREREGGKSSTRNKSAAGGSVSPSTAKKFAVAEGKHAKFRCLVTGKPKPEIVWRKDGETLEAGRRHLIFEDREGYYTLKVLYCKAQDTGLYVCAASNALGNTLSAVHLSVKGNKGIQRGFICC